MTFAINRVTMELHDNANTVPVIMGLLLGQKCDVHVLAIKKLVVEESLDNEIFAET